MCENFEVISMRYDHFLNEDSYYREGRWKVDEWNHFISTLS